MRYESAISLDGEVEQINMSPVNDMGDKIYYVIEIKEDFAVGKSCKVWKEHTNISIQHEGSAETLVYPECA